MARKERNDIDYFPHSVNHGKKMFYLRDKFGNDGYAVWFMLLEQLGKANYHYLDLKDDIQLMYLSSEFKVSELLLNEIIETLVKFDEFDKELWNKEKVLFNPKFIDNISDAYKKRKNECVNKSDLILLLESKGRSLLSKGNPKPLKGNPKPSKLPSKGDENPQSKVKETIEDKSKVEIFDKWISYREDINKPIKVESTLMSLAKRFNDNSIEVVSFVINNSIENGWQGLFWDKVPQEHKQKSTTVDPIVALAQKAMKENGLI